LLPSAGHGSYQKSRGTHWYCIELQFAHMQHQLK
jgi:hypothetical protein